MRHLAAILLLLACVALASAANESSVIANYSAGGQNSMANICNVSAKRGYYLSDSYSLITTTLINNGDENCRFQDFSFTDAIPPEFGLVSEINFSPNYSSHRGNSVTFVFQEFAVGESRVVTYSVPRWVAPSVARSFGTPFLNATIGSIFSAEQQAGQGQLALDIPIAEPKFAIPSIGSQQADASASMSSQESLMPIGWLSGILLLMSMSGFAVYALAVNRKEKGHQEPAGEASGVEAGPEKA
jgi:hypothetical protein